MELPRQGLVIVGGTGGEGWNCGNEWQPILWPVSY